MAIVRGARRHHLLMRGFSTLWLGIVGAQVGCGPPPLTGEAGMESGGGGMTSAAPDGASDTEPLVQPDLGAQPPPPSFDPCEPGPLIELADPLPSSTEHFTHVGADADGWYLIYGNAYKDTEGIHVSRPGEAPAKVAMPGAGSLAVADLGETYLVCYDDGLTTATKDQGFCVGLDRAFAPVAGPIQTPYRSVSGLMHFPGHLWAVAGQGPWPIDDHGAPVAEPPDLGCWPLAWGPDFFVCVRPEHPDCNLYMDPLPDCELEAATRWPDGSTRTPFVKVAPYDGPAEIPYRAAVHGESVVVVYNRHYLDSPTHIVVLDATGQVADDLVHEDTEMGVVAATDDGFVLASGARQGEDFTMLWLTPDGHTQGDGVVATGIPTGRHYAPGLGVHGPGVAAVWLAMWGESYPYSGATYFRALGCAP